MIKVVTVRCAGWYSSTAVGQTPSATLHSRWRAGKWKVGMGISSKAMWWKGGAKQLRTKMWTKNKSARNGRGPRLGDVLEIFVFVDSGLFCYYMVVRGQLIKEQQWGKPEKMLQTLVLKLERKGIEAARS